MIDYTSSNVASTDTLLPCTLKSQVVSTQNLLPISIIVAVAVVIAVATSIASKLLKCDNIMVCSVRTGVLALDSFPCVI